MESAPECPVCLEQYDDSTTVPRVLPCGHSTCATCLRRLHHLTTTSSSLSPSRTLHCPTCTHLVSFVDPTSFPTNFDLLRFSLTIPTTTPNSPPPQRRRFEFIPRLFSDEVYDSWKDWVLPYDAVLTDDRFLGRVNLGSELVIGNEIMRCRLVDGVKVGFLQLDRFGFGDSVVEFSYVSKVMSVLSCMSQEERAGLTSILRVSVRVSRISRVFGLWFDVENGCLYLVSERMTDGLLGLSVRHDSNVDWRGFLGSVGVELCQVLASLWKEGIVCGCLGLSCICFDDFGRVHVDLSEVLVKGRMVREWVVKGRSGGRNLDPDGSEEEDLVVNFSEMDVFVSPEVMLELFSREGIEAENSVGSAVCNGSDVWLLACVLLRLVIGNEFVQGICNYYKAVLEGVSEGVSKSSDLYTKFVDAVNTSLETIMGSDSGLLKDILVKCLDYAPERRPSFSDVWKNIKALNDCQYMNSVSSFDMAPLKEGVNQCLALSELCKASISVRNESGRPNLNRERDDDEVDPSHAGVASVDDVVEELVLGKLQCKDLQGHMDSITGFCVGGGFLFSSSFDKTVNVWSLQDFTHVHTFRGHEHRVMAVVFVDQGKPLCISADNGGGIYSWEVIQPFGQTPFKTWCEEKDWRYSGIHALAVSESGYLYTGSGDRLVKAWSLKDNSLLCSMEGHKSVVSTLAISNGVLYSGSWDGNVRLWSLHDHSPLAVFGEDTPGIVTPVLRLYAEQNVVVAAYEKGHLKIWMNDVLTSSKDVHNGAVLALAIEGSWLFSAGWDKTVRVQEIKRAGADTEFRDVGSIACDSVITALMYVQGILLVGCSNRLIKVFHCRS